ncbi:MAG: PAS domain-containing protein, partial [Phycisphaerales bacterium]|nr:PAS domain-containing protein [Phycisphaerales bacterium]
MFAEITLTQTALVIAAGGASALAVTLVVHLLLRRRVPGARGIARVMRMIEPGQSAFRIMDARTERDLYVSPACDDLWGFAAGEGADPESRFRRVHPDDLERVRQAREDIRRRGQAECTFRITLPDGRERWIRDSMWTINDRRGRPRCYAGAYTDVTEASRMQAALAE